MLDQFLAIEAQLAAGLAVQFNTVSQIPGRPPEDGSKPAELRVITIPFGEPAVKFAIKAFNDTRGSQTVLAITLYDNVIAGKRHPHDLTYRNTIVVFPGQDLIGIIVPRMQDWFHQAATQQPPVLTGTKVTSF